MNRQMVRHIALVFLAALIFAMLCGCSKTHTHEFGEWEIAKEATCTEEGQKISKCSCGEEKFQTIEAVGHTFGEWQTVKEPTCTEEGKQTRSCSCGAEETQSIEPLGHKDGEWEILKEATCTAEGQKQLHCERCTEVIRTETIAAGDHVDGQWVVIKEASCTEEGKQELHCQLCNAVIRTEAIAAQKHKEGEWVTAKIASCTEAGMLELHCQLCNGVIRTETIAALNHKAGQWVTAKEATCTEAGQKQQCCERCSEVLHTETIAALGHKDGQWVTTKQANCTEEGSRELRCERCDAVIRTEKIAAYGDHAYTGTVTQEATCLQSGVKTYTCSRCKDSYTETITCKSYTSTELYDMYVNSVGEIITYDAYGSEYALGTGFVYTSDGKIVTNYHVIEGAYSAVITVAGKEYAVTQVLAYDTLIDLAVLKIDATGLTPVKTCSSEHKVGSPVYAIGSSLGLTATFSDGMITYANRVVDGVSHVQHDAPISSGNSGGPLINAYGEVIGINTWTYEDSQNLNFAISINEMQNLDYSNPMTLEELCNAEGSGDSGSSGGSGGMDGSENEVFSLMASYIMLYGEQDTDEYGDYYYLVLGTDTDDDGNEYMRMAYYYVYDNTITLDCLINEGELWAYFTITDEVTGEYEWVYFDAENDEMYGMLYADSFTENTMLDYEDYYIESDSTVDEICETASILIDWIVWSIDTGFEDVGVTAYDLHFYNYA